MSDGFTIEYTPAGGPRRRVRYEPRAGGDGWWRHTDEWNGCVWRTEGREPVKDVVTEMHDRLAREEHLQDSESNNSDTDGESNSAADNQ